ncbi:MAG: cache domain-containing protein [Anaerolineae bacterium]
MEDRTRRNPLSRLSLRFPVSLRTRLIIANVLIIGISIGVLGYYVLYRSQQANNYLADTLETNVRQRAIDTLTVTGNSQAATLNELFASIRKQITSVGQSADVMLSRQVQPGTAGYWDALHNLMQLPNGSWDNIDRKEPASVFLPARAQLSNPLIAELNSLRGLDFVVPNILESSSDTVAVYFGGLSGETIYYPNVDLANIVPPDFDVTTRPWYIAAAPANNPGRIAAWSTPYLDAAKNGLIITSSYPVYDTQSGFRGVVAMDVQLTRVSFLTSSIRVGNTGYAFILDRSGRLIAMPDAGYKDLGYTAEAMPLGQTFEEGKLSKPLPAGLLPVIQRMRAGQSGLETISVGGQQRYIIFRPIEEVGYTLAIMVPAQEMLAGVEAARQQVAISSTNTRQISFVIMALIMAFGLLAALGISNTLIAPLLGLTATAEEIRSGNLEARARVNGRDEIATLARTLNDMTGRLRELIQSLEQRVKDRTAALEAASGQAARRAAQFEAITQVTRAIGSIRNMDELMPLITAVISQYFGFYHVGIFLNDEQNEFAWLIAANSEGGRRMLQRHHSLKIGAQGIVGYVAAHGESRVARSVGKDAVFFNNPDLPETKSEAALPLRRGSQVAGVLDVQSTKEDAFSDEDLNILAILADQVSLAMENTRLFETTQRSLMEAETLYRQYVQEAWSKLPQEGQITGYRYTPRGAAPISATYDAASVSSATDASSTVAPLVIPIKLRGETIGNLVVQGQRIAGWTQDQVELAQAVAERVALSAENARLFDETNRRAERERLVTEITSRIRSTNDPDEMIRTAVEELRNALGASEIQVIPQVVPADVQREAGAIPCAFDDGSQAAPRGNGARR